MRLIITLIIILLCISAPQAADNAFEKGSKSVSGNFLFTRYSGNAYEDLTILDFSPQYSVCVFDGFFLGVAGQLRRSIYDSQSNYSNSTQWRMGVTGEWYQISRQTSPHPMVPYFRALFLYGKVRDVSVQNLGIQIGVLQMISSSTGIDFGLQGSVDIYSKDGYSSTGFIIQGSLGFTSFIF